MEEDRIEEPRETFCDTLTRDRDDRLNVQSDAGCRERWYRHDGLDLCARLRLRYVLLVRENEDRNTSEIRVPDDRFEFRLGLVESLRVAAVDDEDHGVGFDVVPRPNRTQRSLASEIPENEFVRSDFDSTDFFPPGLCETGGEGETTARRERERENETVETDGRSNRLWSGRRTIRIG